MISSLYRFRSLYWLLDQGELEKQEIYFAKPEQLNDPMEGFRDIFWKGGDQVVTIPVRRNELAAYFQYIHFFALATIFQTHVEHGLQPKREQVSDFNERLRKGLEHANLVVEQVARLEAEARTIIGKLEDAIAGMLPKTKLGKQMYRKLKVYAGDSHPHAAQKPAALAVK